MKQLKPQAMSEWEAEGAFQQRSSAAPIFVAQIMYSHGVVTSLAESILNVQQLPTITVGYMCKRSISGMKSY